MSTTPHTARRSFWHRWPGRAVAVAAMMTTIGGGSLVVAATAHADEIPKKLTIGSTTLELWDELYGRNNGCDWTFQGATRSVGSEWKSVTRTSTCRGAEAKVKISFRQLPDSYPRYPEQFVEVDVEWWAWQDGNEYYGENWGTPRIDEEGGSFHVQLSANDHVGLLGDIPVTAERA